jgi:hypothetical protein
MGRIADILFQNTEFLTQEAPNQATEREKYIQYKLNQQRFERKMDYFKDELTKLGITRRELSSLILNVTGDQAKVDQLLEEGKNRGLYRAGLIKQLKEQLPDKFQEALNSGISETDEDALAEFAKRVVPPEMMEPFQMAGVLQSLVMSKDKNTYFREIENHLSQSHLDKITAVMENYKDIRDIPVEEQQEKYMHKEIQALRQRAESELADQAEKKQQLLDALAFADEHLVKAKPKLHAIVTDEEKLVQGIGSKLKDHLLANEVKTFADGKYDKLFVDTPKDSLGVPKSQIPEDKVEVIRDMSRNAIPVSEGMKNGLKLLMAKFEQMQILGPGEVAQTEDDNKIYAFRAFDKGRARLERAIKGGNIDEIIAASEEHQKNWADMEDLFQLAKDNLGIDPTLFPGNLDSCRKNYLPAHFTFDKATTAAVNGAFMIYNYIHANNISLDEYLANPLNVAYQKSLDNSRKYGVDGVTKGQPFEKAADILYDFTDMNNANFMTKVVDYSVGRAGEFLTYCEPDKKAQTENLIRSGQFYEYNIRMQDLQHHRIGILKGNGEPESKQRTLMNLITVKHGDVPVSQLLDGHYVNDDLTQGEDFSLDLYLKDHPADYEGMIARTETLLEKTREADRTFTEQILEAAQEAYAKTQKAHIEDRDKPEYQKLYEAFRNLEARIPKESTPEFRNRMATRKEALEMTLPGSSATTKWSGAFYDQMAANGDGLEQANRDQLSAVLNGLQTLQQVTASFYQADDQGNLPKVKEEDYKRILDTYRQLADAIGAFHLDGEPKTKAEVNVTVMLEGLKVMVGQDLAGLSAARQGGEATLSDMLKQGRSLKVTVNGPLKNAGDMASTRLRIDVPGADGQPIKGFFTPNTEIYTHEKALALMENAIRRASEKYGHPELADLARTLVSKELDSIFTDGASGEILANGDKVFRLSRERVRKNDRTHLLDGFRNRYDDLTPEQLAAMGTNLGADFVIDVLKEMAPVNTVLAYQHSRMTGNIDRRNCAMSTMADLLGVSHLVAGSRPMTLVQDGKEITGTFMNFAQGWDALDQSPENPLTKVTPDQMITKESLPSLADLQVLDFICGNVDRHNRNFFYRFDHGDPPKFLGVQGIDNDYSFVVNTGANFIKIENMGIITEQMAQKVMTLTPALLETALSPYGLSQEEINAAWERTHQLQGQIQAGIEFYKNQPAGAVLKGHLRVVKEAELGDFGLGSPLYDMGIFNRAMLAPGTNNLLAQEAKEKALDENMQALRDSTPDLERALNAVTDANRGFFIGSKAYDNAMKGVRDVVRARNEATEQADPQKLETYAEQLETAKASIATYLLNKTKIPAERRNALENRRIEAMSLAYATLDREAVRVTATAAIAKKLPMKQDPEIMARREQIDRTKRIVKSRIQSRHEKESMSKAPDEYECDIMKQFREKVRDQTVEAMEHFDFHEPTEEQKQNLVDIAANNLTHQIISTIIRFRKTPEEKQADYRNLQEHPEILSIMKGKVLQSEPFKKLMLERTLPYKDKFMDCMAEISSYVAPVSGDIRWEVADLMKNQNQKPKVQEAQKELQADKTGPEKEQDPNQLQQPQIEVPQIPM